MKKCLGLLVLGVLVSCSHVDGNKKVVQFPYADELLKKVQLSPQRIPASVLESEEEISPRRVYFSALYQQYLTFAKHLGKKSDLNFCPQFHHDKVAVDSSSLTKVLPYTASHVASEGRAYFPELVFGREFSLKDYQSMLKSELVTLCEEGVSDNYYKFDNLVTHYAHKKSFHTSPKAMASVLKIPVFANFYLVKMLEVPGVNFASLEEKRMIKLTGTHWFETYVSEARHMRSQFIKNKMVSR